jgi:hypothetical protein
MSCAAVAFWANMGVARRPVAATIKEVMVFRVMAASPLRLDNTRIKVLLLF